MQGPCVTAHAELQMALTRTTQLDREVLLARPVPATHGRWQTLAPLHDLAARGCGAAQVSADTHATRLVAAEKPRSSDIPVLVPTGTAHAIRGCGAAQAVRYTYVCMYIYIYI